MNKIILISILSILILLVGCAPKTIIVQQTVLVTEVVEKVITATPLPLSPTPEVTTTPIFQKWTTTQVVQAFKEAGLEVEDPKIMTKQDYGKVPMTAVEGVHFWIPSKVIEAGGRIFSFANEQDLKITQTYFESLGKSSAAFFSWIFNKDNILVQINGVPETKAKLYQQALDTLK